MSILLIREKRKKVLTTGDKAIARGALESGMGFFTTYPGTPASGIGDSLYEVRNQLDGFHFEYSMNEKIAVEGAIGAAWTGIRSMAAMKQLGMNVAADPLHYVTNRGIIKGMVIVNGSDPGMQSSGTEQDNRFYSLHTHLPVIQPSNVQEAKDFTCLAYALSDRFCIPFVIDAPSVLLHGIGELDLGELPSAFPGTGRFQPQVVTEEIRLLGRVGKHKMLLDQEARIREYAADSPLNRWIPGTADWGIVTCGVSFGYTLEVLQLLGLKDIPILKLGLVHPISPGLIERFMKDLHRVVIVEESGGFLENQIKAAAYDFESPVPIVGKAWFSPVGMQSATRIAVEFGKHLGLPMPEQFKRLPAEFIENTDRLAGTLAPPAGESVPIPGFFQAPSRKRGFCAGCPHRCTAYAIKKATRGKALVGGDIGCYNISAVPPFELYSWHFCMGAGLGIGQAIAQKLKDTPIMAMIGDSTLFHAGMPAVLNAVFYDANILLMVLDNRWTAMTGHQPTPSSGATLDGRTLHSVSIPKILEALGVKWVKTANPFKVKAMVALIKEGLKQKGMKAIVAEGECTLQSGRRDRQAGIASGKRYGIDEETCTQCGVCYVDFGCPAIVEKDVRESKIYQIDQALCTRCGACTDICTSGALSSVE